MTLTGNGEASGAPANHRVSSNRVTSSCNNRVEELGSGRFCAATYECSDDSGELWGDLANHNGRRAIGATSPVANQRDWVITVDGKASARWLTGYRPEGRLGELVGLTTSADALRPVVRTTATTETADGGRSLLHYILERHDTSSAEIAELGCGDYRRETDSYTRCIGQEINRMLAVPPSVGSTPDNELTRCLVGHHENWCRQNPLVFLIDLLFLDVTMVQQWPRSLMVVRLVT